MNDRKDYYSPLKIFHHRDRIADLRDGMRPDLLHVQLILTNRCNERCSFCAYRSLGYASSLEFVEQDQIETAKALEIIDDCSELGVRAIELTGGGEPTIHPDFAKVCQHIYAKRLEYAVVTNGSSWAPEVLNAMRWASWVRVSMDCARPSTYAALRHSSEKTYAQVRKNISLLKEYSTAVVGVGFVVTKENWTEIFEAAHNAKEDGADNFRISAVFQNGGLEYFQPFYGLAHDLCYAAKELEDEHFTVFNLFGDRLADLKQQTPYDPFCPLQQLITYVGADLGVYRCCVVAYNPKGFLGSLRGQRFFDLWNSEDVAFKLSTFNAMTCPRCMFNAKNATIRYAVNPDPGHVNFL